MVKVCIPCGKDVYESKAAALEAVKLWAPAERVYLGAYLCEQGCWHIGHPPGTGRMRGGKAKARNLGCRPRKRWKRVQQRGRRAPMEGME